MHLGIIIENRDYDWTGARFDGWHGVRKKWRVGIAHASGPTARTSQPIKVALTQGSSPV